MSKAQFACPADLAQDFAYGAPANDAAGLRLSLSIFADRPHLRDQMRDDALSAGFRIAEAGDVASLLDGDARPLGDVVLVLLTVPGGATGADLPTIRHELPKGVQVLVVDPHRLLTAELAGLLLDAPIQILRRSLRCSHVVPGHG